MKHQRLGQRALKKTILAALLLGSVSAAQAALFITFNPIIGEPGLFRVTASGTGSAVGSTVGIGASYLNLDGKASYTTNGFGSGLVYGGAPFVRISPGPGQQLSFTSSATAPAGTHSFSGLSGDYTLNEPYSDAFPSPGTFTFSSSTGIFGTTATGTVVISTVAVPEPASASLLLGLCATLLIARRRR